MQSMLDLEEIERKILKLAKNEKLSIE